MPGYKERRKTSSDGEIESPERIRRGRQSRKGDSDTYDREMEREIMKGIKSMMMSRSCRLLKQLREIADMVLHIVRIF